MIMKNRVLRIFSITVIIIISFFCFLYYLGTKSEAYTIAIGFIDNSTLIKNSIGVLKSHRLAFLGYSVRYCGPRGYAEYKIYITAEKGDGEVYLNLEKSVGEWKVIKGNLMLENGVSIPLVNQDL
jgi:hypothetical protein